MSATVDPRLDALLDDHPEDLVALVVEDRHRAHAIEALVIAAAGASLETPSYRTEDAEVLLFAEPGDAEVRDDLPARIRALRVGHILPPVLEWLTAESMALTQLPTTFLAQPATDEAERQESYPVEHEDAAPLAEPECRDGAAINEAEDREAPDQRLDQEEEDAPAGRPPLDTPIGQGVSAADAGLGVGAMEAAMIAPPATAEAPPHAVLVDLPERPTEGPEIAWQIDGGRLVVTRAPIDPAAVPTAQQSEAVAALLRAVAGGTCTTLDSWRAECRATWQNNMAPGSILKAFTRCRAIIEERGAIAVDGRHVRLCLDADAPVAASGAVRRVLRSLFSRT